MIAILKSKAQAVSKLFRNSWRCHFCKTKHMYNLSEIQGNGMMSFSLMQTTSSWLEISYKLRCHFQKAKTLSSG